MKKFLALLLAMLIGIATLVSPLSVYAGDYVTNEDNVDDEGNVYYIVEGKDVEQLFDLRLKNIVDGSIIPWLFQFKTFVVLKEYEDYDTGKTTIKGYFNTPNIQSLAKNLVISNINDGYTDDTYDVNDAQWLVKVGDEATKVNAISRYGFKIPNYTYNGEYPKAYMSVQNILPTSFWDAIWRFFRSLFGLSFINPPDARNFRTITYWNHEYSDKEETLINFIADNYYPWFYTKIHEQFTATSTQINSSSGYFSDKGAKDFQDSYVTESQVTDAANVFAKSSAVIEQWKIDALTAGLPYDKKDVKLDMGSGWSRLNPMRGTTDQYSSDICYLIVQQMAAIIEEYNNKKVPPYAILKHGAQGDPYRDILYSFALNAFKSAYHIPSDNTDYDSMSFSNGYLNTGTVDYTTQSIPKYTNTGEVEKDTQGNELTINAPKYLDRFVARAYTNDYEVSATPFYENGVRIIIPTTGMSLPLYLEVEDDFITAEMRAVIDRFNKWKEMEARWASFSAKFNSGSEKDKKQIHYNQCLIENQGEDKECWSKKHSDQRVTMAVGNMYVFSGLYRSIDMSKYSASNSRLSHEDAVQVIQTIQNFAGPYYSEVMSNLIIVMSECAKANGGKIDVNKNVDARVMPYDVDSMVAGDKTNFTVVDPRVDIYKNSLIGGIVSSLRFNINLGGIFKIQSRIINFAGTLTELSVFFQHMINFDFFDDIGLSPTTMWQNAFVTIAILFLVLAFIIKTVIHVFKYLFAGSSSPIKIISMFLVLLMEIGLLTALVINPTGMWNSTKTTMNLVMNLGEEMTMTESNIQYLFGSGKDRDPATTYYLPYLDIWSTYNTGYGILVDEQDMNKAAGTPEINKLDLNDNWPKVNTAAGDSSKITHWSVLLIDSFEYHGHSISLHGIDDADGNHINGKVINNNAYRVVDHFLAPRVNITKAGSKLHVETTENENYNGQFQTGVINLVPKLMNVVLVLILSALKLLTFFWLWFKLYIFVFNVILARSFEGKSWKQLLLETFSPLLAIVLIGIWAGMCVKIAAYAVGLVGILIMVALYVITIVAFRYWSRAKAMFPKTLVPIALLVDMRRVRHKHDVNRDANVADTMANQSTLGRPEDGVDTFKDPNKYLNYLFDENGNVRGDLNNTADRAMYEKWIDTVRKRQKATGQQATAEERRALLNYMNSSAIKNYNDDPANRNKQERYDPDTFERIKRYGRASRGDADNKSSGRRKRKQTSKEDDANG